jgi:chemotaxis protein MotA
MKKNIVPIVGLSLGIGLIIWSITSSGNIASFLDVPSLVITLGGSFSAILISFPLKSIKKLPSILKNLLLDPNPDYAKLIETFTALSRKARSQGILAIEADIEEQDNELMVIGLQMAVDGLEPETVRDIMEITAENIEKRHRIGQDIFLKWGEMAPAFGMIGTLIGLVIMLGELNDPSTIGVGMATALITTFYGSFLANLVFIPIASNLQMQTNEEMKSCEMIIEGVLSLQAGENPRVIEQKLKGYLPFENKEEALKAAVKLQQEEQNYG